MQQGKCIDLDGTYYWNNDTDLPKTDSKECQVSPKQMKAI